MSSLTFLTDEQIHGEKKIDIIKKCGIECIITDFAILLGGAYCRDEQNNYIGAWWTKTPHNDRGTVNNPYNSSAYFVNSAGIRHKELVFKRECGARPVLPYLLIYSKDSNKTRDENGILEVEYGEYPQTIVSEDISEVLEKAYSKNKLKPTGKTYTTNSTNLADTTFQAKTHIEYEYNGKKYIRFEGISHYSGYVMLSSKFTQDKKFHWIEVEPIKWIIDEKEGLAISKKILFAGISFLKDKIYTGDFETTDIKKFMDEYFLKDIIKEDQKQIQVNKVSNKKRENPYGFKYSEVSEEEIISGAIESDIPVFLHGPSSVGKSSRVKQIDPDCVVVHMENATLDSFIGKSVYNQDTGEMTDYPPTWYTRLKEKCEKEPDKIHILFFDEFTHALPSVQGKVNNVVLDREVNGVWKLPDNVRIVAAGNEMSDSLAANQMVETVFNRFAHVYLKPNVENWLKWALANNIHPAIYAFIAYKREKGLMSQYTGEKPNADQRKWEMASKMLYKTNNPAMLRSLIGADITNEFCQFCTQKVITIEDVLNDNYDEVDLQMETSAMYATVMILSYVDEANFMKVREFVLKLGKEPCTIFDSLWAREDETRLEIIAEARLANKGGKRNNG